MNYWSKKYALHTEVHAVAFLIIRLANVTAEGNHDDGKSGMTPGRENCTDGLQHLIVFFIRPLKDEKDCEHREALLKAPTTRSIYTPQAV